MCMLPAASRLIKCILPWQLLHQQEHGAIAQDLRAKYCTAVVMLTNSAAMQVLEQLLSYVTTVKLQK